MLIDNHEPTLESSHFSLSLIGESNPSHILYSFFLENGFITPYFKGPAPGSLLPASDTFESFSQLGPFAHLFRLLKLEFRAPFIEIEAPNFLVVIDERKGSIQLECFRWITSVLVPLLHIPFDLGSAVTFKNAFE